MFDARLAAALDDCIRGLRAGLSRDDCLRAQPGLRSQLAPLLNAASGLQAQAPASFDASARSRVRAGLMDAIGREAASAAPPRPLRLWRPAFAPAVALAVAALLLFVGLPWFGSNGAAAETVLTVLQGDVVVETEGGAVPGRDRMLLRPNDRVITGDAARAVLTFFDGSSVTLESGTVLLIASVAEEDAGLRAVLVQERGRTWTHVPAPGVAKIEIDTPNARVETRTSSFETTVSDDGRTDVDARGGPVSVESGDSRVEVPAGHTSTVETPGIVTPPSVAAPPARVLVVAVHGPVLAYLVDPAGAAVGLVAPAQPVNQIRGAAVVREGDRIVIRVPEPADGRYGLRLLSLAAGRVAVTAIVRSEGHETPLASIDVGPGDVWNLGFAVHAAEVSRLGLARDLPVKPDRVSPRETDVDPTASPTPVKRDTAPPQVPTATAMPSPTPTPTATPPPALTPGPGPNDDRSLSDAP